MPKYEDLEFLKEKILNIGNEENILSGKNLSVNKTSIPVKVNDLQTEAEKDILDSGDLLKDITEDFKENVDIEENFSDLKEEKVDDFLSSLTSKDVSNEEEIIGSKAIEEESSRGDSFDIESLDNISNDNVTPENIFEKKDFSESQKDWENLKEESLSDLDLMNIEESVHDEDETKKNAEEPDMSAIFDVEEPKNEEQVDLTRPQDEFNLDDLIDNKEKKVDNLDDLLKTHSEIEEEPEQENKQKDQKGIDDGLVDLAGDFASHELIEEEKSQIIDQTLSDLFPEEKKDDTGFDEFVEKSEQIEQEKELPSDDIFSEIPIGDDSNEKIEENLPLDEREEQVTFDVKDKLEKSIDKPFEEFDLSNLDSLSDMPEKEFEIEKQSIEEGEVADQKFEGLVYNEEIVPDETQERVSQKDNISKDKSVIFSDADRKKIVTVLSRLPKEAELKIAKAIVSNKFSDKELKPLIDILIAAEKPQTIFRVYERITGDKSLSKIEISKYTGEEFQKYQSSFSYQFKKNILPIISKLAVGSLFALFIIAIIVLVVMPTINASINYAAGKKNLKAKKFYDVEKYFDTAYAIQKRYNEVVEYADLYRDSKRYVEAEKKYDLAFSMKPNNDLKLKIADFFRELREFERSAKLYNEVLKDNRDNINAEIGIAKTYFDWSFDVSEKINDAKDAYQEALRINDKNPEAVSGLLNIYIKEKNNSQITKVYNYSEKNIKKIDPAVYADLAGYFIDQENLDYVKNILQKASKNTNNKLYPEIDYQWARYKKYLNISNEEKIHLENAINKFDNMKKVDENRYETKRYKELLASTYNDLGENYDRYSKINIKAEEYFIKAIQTYPEYGKAYYNLGNFALKNKIKYDEALKNYQTAEEYGYVNDNQTYVIGWLDYKKEDYIESFKRVNSLLEKYPENSNLKLMVGTIFYKMNNFDLAESILSETFDYYDELRQVRSPLSMNKKDDRNIVNMLISLGNNLGATLQKKYEQTKVSKYLISATRYYSASIENFGRLKEIPDSVLKEEITQEDFDMVKMNKFPVTDVHINLRMVLYPKLGVEDPKLFEDFPIDF